MTSAISPTAVISALVGTSSSTVLAANLTRLGLYVFNPSATVTIWIAPASGPQSAASPSGAANPAAINGAGSIPLQPQQGLLLGAPEMPPFTNALNAICNTPSTPLTIWEFYP